jgi:6-phosphogluconolactonase/glucosamine-6-phosphate isomerase/deaminase
LINIENFDDCSQASKSAASALVDSLTDNRAKNSLLLVSGGSSAKVVYWASSDLDINVTNSTTLAQVDERYGEVGHEDSNWRHLLELGVDPSLFNQQIEMLKLGLSADDIASVYSRNLQEQLDQSEFSMAVLGLGADGHIAGIMPSEEEEFDRLFLGHALVTAYKTEEYERLTITAKALLQMDKVIVYACGEEKSAVISELGEEHSPHQFPAEILKKCMNVKVFYGKEDK